MLSKKVFLVFILITILIAACFQLPDKKSYKISPFYQKMKENSALSFSEAKNPVKPANIKAGWAKVPLNVDFVTPLAGYGIRKTGGALTNQEDIWVRAIVFDNSLTKAAYVSLDMLIVPPEVANSLSNAMSSENLTHIAVYLTATHTHSSLGGWARGFVGNIFAGPYNPQIVKIIVKRTVAAIKNAEMNLSEVKIGYKEISAKGFITNKLNRTNNIIDPWLRVLKFVNKSGESAAIISYSAHAVCLGPDNNNVSGDYPGVLNRILEKSGYVGFSLFSAGAVGGMLIPIISTVQVSNMNIIAQGLGKIILDHYQSIPVQSETRLKFIKLPLELRESQIKLFNALVLRPWVVKILYPYEHPYILSLLVGRSLFIGLPCDYSGEFNEEITAVGKTNDLHVIINSFNGGYIGYVFPEKYTNLNRYDTRTMNWYGHDTGTYLQETIKSIIPAFSNR